MDASTIAIGGISLGTIFLMGLITLGMWGCPQYNVYSQKMEGEAQLAHAEYSKRVQVQDALGKLEAAKSLGDAEVARARGVAEANKIIGSSLRENEAYLKYLWIINLNNDANKETIYIPTEAGIPILEAGRLHKQ